MKNARCWVSLVLLGASIWVARDAAARPRVEPARRVEAVVDERAPVVWRAARGRGTVVDGAGRRGLGELAVSLPRHELRARIAWADGSVLALRGFRLLSVERGDGIALRGLIDLVDGAGGPVARDRPVEVVIAEGAARVALPAVTLDGRPDAIPGVAGDLTLAFEGVKLAQPSRAPRSVLEVTRDRQRPVGGALRVKAVDGRRDRLDQLRLAIRRGDGSALVVRGTAIDAARGGVVVGRATASYGRVALAVWGWCDVTDASGRTVASRRPLTLWITPDGVTRVSVPGVLHARLAGTLFR